ncbi:putative folylpolyglutamate synthase, mitochondrial-like isoform X2 [Apostichopus japonicus]|uniref:tetrahydrofolate synthase n=1 Tax=Stichopus japonicus TaxID=307972 RepID=A0A2G8KLN2_STIJA|nr:putative folylpolyglutamate synthase, mitochondrial-like isoform X2 [Apostichopus japonicus]
MRDSKETVKKLNKLQSPSEELEKLRKVEGAIVSRMVGPHCVKSMQQFLERCGITMEDINSLSIIHVAGTKGKGSVCAFCEKILQKYGLKTGLLISPHLIEVRERIRIDGKPVDQKTFCDYFDRVFRLLDGSKDAFEGEMPAYNRMVAVMGLFICLEEEVDVLILEVGCGGEYDYTNFIQQPVVTGITSLGMDHVKSLGDTLAKIAWHKAGIFKPGKPAFTVPQPREAMQVISERSVQIKTTVECVPSIERYNLDETSLQLGLHGRYQYTNAALAVQLCQKFLEETKKEKFTYIEPAEDDADTKRMKMAEANFTSDNSTGADLGMVTSHPFILPENFITGLRECYWPGRSQTIQRERVTYYLDGAHTARSLQACVDWFIEASGEEDRNSKGRTAKILLFNLKVEKYKPSMVKPLLNCNFDAAVFCPNYLYEKENPEDLTYRYKTRETELIKSKDVKQMVESVLCPSPSTGDEAGPSSLDEEEQDPVDAIAMDSSETEGGPVVAHTKCVWMPSISTALSWAACGKDPSLEPSSDTDYPEIVEGADRIQVLVTGSLYLVGGVLQLIDPELVVN